MQIEIGHNGGRLVSQPDNLNVRLSMSEMEATAFARWLDRGAPEEQSGEGYGWPIEFNHDVDRLRRMLDEAAK